MVPCSSCPSCTSVSSPEPSHPLLPSEQEVRAPASPSHFLSSNITSQPTPISHFQSSAIVVLCTLACLFPVAFSPLRSKQDTEGSWSWCSPWALVAWSRQVLGSTVQTLDERLEMVFSELRSAEGTTHNSSAYQRDGHHLSSAHLGHAICSVTVSHNSTTAFHLCRWKVGCTL